MLESLGDFLLSGYKMNFPWGKVKQNLLKWGKGSGTKKWRKKVINNHKIFSHKENLL